MIVLTTHYLDEAAALANRLLVLARGLIVAQGTPRPSAAATGCISCRSGRTATSWVTSGRRGPLRRSMVRDGRRRHGRGARAECLAAGRDTELHDFAIARLWLDDIT